MEQVSNYCTRHVGGRSDEELSNRLSKLLRSKSTSIATEKKISIIKDEISKRSSMQEETFNGFSVKDGKFTSLWYDHSPNNSGQFQKPIKYIVMHYTANASSVSTRSLFMDDSARGKPSSHFIIGDDLSSTFQVVSLVDIAHHAGISSYGNDKYLNNCSIGIEVVNWGKLTRTESGAFKSWCGVEIPDTEVVPFGGSSSPVTYWQAYPHKQICCLVDIFKAILLVCPSIQEVVQHSEIAPDRKIDPGPAFPIDVFRSIIDDHSKLYTTADDLYVVDVSSTLNVRGGAGVEFPVIKGVSPLHKGCLVEVLDSSLTPWSLVNIVEGSSQGNTGYVFDKFLKKFSG